MDDQKISSILGHTACVVTIAEVSNLEDSTKLIDFVTGLRVPMKHLLLIAPKLDINLLLNRNINFDIQVMDASAGMLKIWKRSCIDANNR